MKHQTVFFLQAFLKSFKAGSPHVLRRAHSTNYHAAVLCPFEAKNENVPEEKSPSQMLVASIAACITDFSVSLAGEQRTNKRTEECNVNLDIKLREPGM